MNQIVKAETAPTMSQATASASVLIALIVALAGLGVFAALQTASVASVVFAIVIALTALIVSPASVTPRRCHAFSLPSWLFVFLVGAAPPTHTSRGLSAYLGVNAHAQGFTCERSARCWFASTSTFPPTCTRAVFTLRVAQNADHFT